MAALRFLFAMMLALPVPGYAAPAAADDPAPTAQTPVARRFFVETPDDKAMVKAELAKARTAGKLAVIVFGADWCHDSRSLAMALTSPAFTKEFGSRFAVILVDVGAPQAGQGRNLDLVQRYGIRALKSTPAMVVVSPQGKRLNTVSNAVSWKDADSRGPAAILQWFRDFPKR